MGEKAPRYGVSRGIRELPAPADDGRVESGPVQFGDDWPGVFIRGDNAAMFAMNLAAVIQGKGQNTVVGAFALASLIPLYNRLRSCALGPTASLFPDIAVENVFPGEGQDDTGEMGADTADALILEALKDYYNQHRCGCGHGACRACARDARALEAINTPGIERDNVGAQDVATGRQK